MSCMKMICSNDTITEYIYGASMHADYYENCIVDVVTHGAVYACKHAGHTNIRNNVN